MASSLETNKVLAAILTAGIIASGSGVITTIIYNPSPPAETAYQIAVAEDGDADAEAPEEAAPLPVLLAEASPEDGESIARACAACHSFEQGGPTKIGPPLWDVVGSDIASVEGFAYSDALAGKEGEWTFEALSGFLEDPQAWAPGTNMSYAGVKDAEDRADLLVYLRSLSEDPVALPEVPEGEAEVAAAEEQPAEAAAGEEDGAAEGDDLAARLVEASAEEGENAVRVCAACHSFEQGGPHKIGPALWGVVGSDIASAEDYSYSDALSQKEGAWTYEKLDAYLADPMEWAPGTKMAFAGINDDDQRADVIKYLRSLAEEPEPLPEGG